MEALNDSIDCFVNKNYEGRSGVYEKIKIVDGINNLNLNKDTDTKGDLYEYFLLSRLQGGT